MFMLSIGLKGTLEKENVALGVFLDLAKAFDCLNCDIFFKKVSLYGIKGITLKWYNSY